MSELSKAKVVDSEFVPVYETDKGNKVVVARELHESLVASTRFNDWAKRNIISVGFIEGQDFYSFLSKTNGRPSNDNILTLDTAKHIAMIQRTHLGMQIRQKFIDLEKQVNHSIPNSIEDLIIMQANSVKELKTKVETLESDTAAAHKRIDNYDKVNPNGDEQQQLNKMIRLYAAKEGIQFHQAWRNFRQAYNTAFRTNLTVLIENHKMRNNLNTLTMPEYLSATGRIEDGIRVADKLLNGRGSNGRQTV